MTVLSPPADGWDRLPSELPPSPWWELLPLAERLIALLQPAQVQVAAAAGALPERHLRECIHRLSPGSRLLLTAAATGSGSALLLFDGLPPPAGFDLPAWLEAGPGESWILLRQGRELANLDQQFPGWEVRWSALPQLLVPVAASPAWGAQLEQEATALLERGRQLKLLSLWAQREQQRVWQAHQGDAQGLLDAAHAKLEAIETSTAWRATAPLRACIDRVAELRAGMRTPARSPRGASNGRAEATTRQPRFGQLRQVPGRQPIDPGKPSLLVITHDSSFTGAPILAWNLCRSFQDHANVIALTLSPGRLDQALLEDCCLLLQPSRPGQTLSPELLRGGLGPLPDGLRIELALVNTIQCWEWPRWLHGRGIPSLLLIHEFAAYIRPAHAFEQACTWATAVVFSSPITWRDMTRRHPRLAGVPVELLPQGRCALPGPAASGPVHFRLSDLPELRRHHSSAWLESCQLVLGAGEVQPRKGVDLFVETANRLHSAHPQAPWLFLWLGSHYDPERDFTCSIWIEDQIQRSGLSRHLHILGPSRERYAALLGRAQLFLLPSRLDPLPNVAIDALHEGVPVLCFAGASGIADWMTDQPELAEACLARYLDPAQLADRAEALLLDAGRRQKLGELAQRQARDAFAMKRYLAGLEAIGRQCRRRRRQQDLDKELLEQAGCLDATVCLPPGAEGANEPVLPYLLSWSRNILPRKPFAGLHPGVYAEGRQLEAEDPLGPLVARRPAGRQLAAAGAGARPRRTATSLAGAAHPCALRGAAGGDAGEAEGEQTAAPAVREPLRPGGRAPCARATGALGPRRRRAGGHTQPGPRPRPAAGGVWPTAGQGF